MLKELRDYATNSCKDFSACFSLAEAPSSKVISCALKFSSLS